MVDPKHESFSPLMQTGLLPQEEMLEIGRKQKKLIIGIPKENQKTEKRIGLTPEAVEILVEDGHEVILERGAGEGVHYTDTAYSEMGGFIVDDKRKVLNADIIIKASPFTLSEIEDLKGNQLLLSPLQIIQRIPDYFRKLMQKKITAVAFESIMNEHGCYSIQQSMHAISGSVSINIASELLSNSQHGGKGKGILLGGISGITPTEVVILGAGTAAEYAARAAIGYGAFVRVFDTSPQRLEEFQQRLGQRVYTSIFHPKVFKKALVSGDVLIGAIEMPKTKLHYLVSEDMVKTMKKGAVIIDLNIDEGGCIETSECRTIVEPLYERFGVIHYCVANITSKVARTASIALSNVLYPIILKAGNSGGAKAFLRYNAGVRQGVYIYNGILTSELIGNQFNIPYKDIDLLMAAF